MPKLINKTRTDPIQFSIGYFVHLHSLMLLRTGLQCAPKMGTGKEALTSRIYILSSLPTIPLYGSPLQLLEPT